MKTLVIVTALVFGQLASATMPVVGPYIQKTIGVIGSDAPWATCRIYPHVVMKQTGKEGKPSQPIEGIDPAALSQTILEASQGELKTSALHIRATDPKIEITAGVWMTQPAVETFVLYRDASVVETRTGQASASLLKLAQQFCADLKAE